jgi:hypothetical protein
VKSLFGDETIHRKHLWNPFPFAPGVASIVGDG